MVFPKPNPVDDKSPDKSPKYEVDKSRSSRESQTSSEMGAFDGIWSVNQRVPLEKKRNFHN